MRDGFYSAAFQRFLDMGMTHLEALRQFNQKHWKRALLAELEGGGKQLLQFAAKAGREEMNEQDMGLAIELWLAGWTSETPHLHSQQDVMSWFWRRPPRRPGKPGRRFNSTHQAYRHMKQNK